ncbi:RhuM family protein [uncultured Faecalicoccus sp.]|uniref:RhuM family protein n=1 Tax=uncultured Faecalicoccus sp. TaxID=1971760 RepID=UPI002584B29A|nr:RhuM family protein [uncultured Faecalicoccus sp.]
MTKDIVLFKNGELELEVTVSEDREDVWLSQKQMAKLFNVDRTRVTRHINNIYKEGELDEESTCAENAHMGALGVQHYSNKIYNLDMILAVGYRVKSPNGIIFRKWATSVLKDYMIKGYAINQKRLNRLNKTIKIQNRMLASTLEIDETEVFNVIEAYQSALSLLDDYDHNSISKPKGTDSIYRLTYEESRALMDTMKYESDVFGVEKEEGKLKGILEAIYQHVFGQELYPSMEEKAAYLLYFLIKDHPFVDGCKRIGVTIFLEFLNKNHHLFIDGKQIISNNTLVAITLMIAQSMPEEKETMVNLVMHFLST